MATVVMNAPRASGTVQSEYGSYRIVNSQVTVDARLVQPLIEAGFTIANVGFATVDQVVAMLSTKADLSSIPVIASNIMPQPESSNASPGVSGQYVPGVAHVHPRLTYAGYGTSNASGVITVTWTKPLFDKMPCPILAAVGQPGIGCNVSSWTQDANNNYIGATIFVSKRTAATTPTTAVVLSVNVLTGASTATTDAPVAGQLVSIVMLAQS